MHGSDSIFPTLPRSFRGEWITMAAQLSPGTFGIPRPIWRDRAQNVCHYPIIDWITAESPFNAKALLCWSSRWTTEGRQCRHGWQCQTNMKEKFCWQRRFLFTVFQDRVSTPSLLSTIGVLILENLPLKRYSAKFPCEQTQFRFLTPFQSIAIDVSSCALLYHSEGNRGKQRETAKFKKNMETPLPFFKFWLSEH